MTKTVDAFLSVQSPYCYFAAPRLRRLAAHPDVAVHLRLVSPGVIRIPETYADRGKLEQAYFRRDVARTAAFLGLGYAEARPYPVAFQPGTLYRAATEQPRVNRLQCLMLAAADQGQGLAFYEAAMTVIWNGETEDWHLGPHLERAAESVGVDWNTLSDLAEAERERLLAAVAANDRALLSSGHWGVPCFVFDGEPFYGQDRFDQLLWRLGLEAKAIGS